VLSESLEHDTIVNVVKAKAKIAMKILFMMLMFKLVFVFLLQISSKYHGNIPKELQSKLLL
jgi:uncharacterized membrane protein